MNHSPHTEERRAPSLPGMPVLILAPVLMIAGFVGLIGGAVNLDQSGFNPGGLALVIGSVAALGILGPLGLAGLKVLKPNEALVLTLFGDYYGTLKGPGFSFVNPFVTAAHPASAEPTTGQMAGEKKQTVMVGGVAIPASAGASPSSSKKLSLKALTLNNDKQKVNDALGNPIIIGIVVVWRVVNTAKAVFNVDNYTEYLSIQCDSALRNIVRLYPYDSEEDEKSLRGSSQEIAESLKREIQSKVELAGLEIMEARITHLSYAPEIAQAMLQRQQATAIIAARQKIVEGAVGMVEMALAKLSDKRIVDLDEERKAAMVSNLLVVLCGNRDAQPVVNSGSIY